MILIRSLSGRLLLLTIVFVMIAEVLVFVPSVARFRRDYLQERLTRAQIASLALLATPDHMVMPELEAKLLDNAGVRSIVFQRNLARELMLAGDMPPAIDETFDLRGAGPLTLIRDALACVVAPAGRVIRVIGMAGAGGDDVIEAVLDEAPLKARMIDFGFRVLVLSLMISVVTAALIVFSVRRFLVRPMTAVIDNMRAFQRNPEDASLIISPDSGIAEIAAAQAALAEMETGMQGALRQKARLAALGEAVAKISHDLRNILSTAQLLADRLEGSVDPTVARVGPKLISSLDRAIALCQSTLSFGKAEEAPPEPRLVALRALVEEVRAGVFADSDGADAQGRQKFLNKVPAETTVLADPDQLYRILSNLVRNARQALEATGRAGAVSVCAAQSGEGLRIDICDDGPGLPARALDNLFTPFKGGARRGGSGLGLAIAAELARGHGGDVTLLRSTTEGTVFRVTLPNGLRAPDGGRAPRDDRANGAPDGPGRQPPDAPPSTGA